MLCKLYGGPADGITLEAIQGEDGKVTETFTLYHKGMTYKYDRQTYVFYEKGMASPIETISYKLRGDKK